MPKVLRGAVSGDHAILDSSCDFADMLRNCRGSLRHKVSFGVDLLKPVNFLDRKEEKTKDSIDYGKFHIVAW